MEEGSGTTTADISSNSEDCTFQASTEDPSWNTSNTAEDAPGFTGTSTASIAFDGSDYMQCTTMDLSGWTGLTTVSWIYWNDSGTDEHTILSNEDGGNDTAGILYRVEPGGNWLESFITLEANTATGGNFTDQTLTSDTWHHAALLYDQVALQSFLDGVVSTTTFAATSALDSDAETARQMVIGARGSGTDDFTGDIDETAIFDVALTSTDINDMMDNGLVQVAAAVTATTLHNATLHNATIH